MNERQFGAQADGGWRRRSGCGRRRPNASICCWTSRTPLQRGGDGWFSADDRRREQPARATDSGSTARSMCRIPASAFQPDDVFGPSEVIDHAQLCVARRRLARTPWHEAVVIESHVGTFTPEGTYRAMIGKLDHLVATGITALELMPLADFAGQRNWGYDGVLWYAPDSAYGRPDDLKALIDEAHLRGLMVFLDVVYNHFGPEGNYLGRYAPAFFTEAQTPWGSAIDYRVPRSARLRHRECAVLARRIPLRRAAARCGACHCRAGRDFDAARSQPRGRRTRRRDRPAYSSGAGKRRQSPRACSIAATGPAARQISRAMERRLSPRLACAADRRKPRLLQRLSTRAAS